MKFSIYPEEAKWERDLWEAVAYPVNPERPFIVEVPYYNDHGQMSVGSKGL